MSAASKKLTHMELFLWDMRVSRASTERAKADVTREELAKCTW
jgi:hypothetical protein